MIISQMIALKLLAGASPVDVVVGGRTNIMFRFDWTWDLYD